jgi:hypothetical protein
VGEAGRLITARHEDVNEVDKIRTCFIGYGAVGFATWKQGLDHPQMADRVEYEFRLLARKCLSHARSEEAAFSPNLQWPSLNPVLGHCVSRKESLRLIGHFLRRAELSG